MDDSCWNSRTRRLARPDLPANEASGTRIRNLCQIKSPLCPCLDTWAADLPAFCLDDLFGWGRTEGCKPTSAPR